MSAIELRSDTVMRPSAAMRRAMAEAEVGDAAGGKVMPPAVTAGIVTAARTAGMRGHLDGAGCARSAPASPSGGSCGRAPGRSATAPTVRPRDKHRDA